MARVSQTWLSRSSDCVGVEFWKANPVFLGKNRATPIKIRRRYAVFAERRGIAEHIRGAAGVCAVETVERKAIVAAGVALFVVRVY